MLPEPNRSYTWDEVRAWEGEERWELIEGVPYAMSGPSTVHQALVGEMYYKLRDHFNQHRCRVFLSPIDVKLSERDVVQPDLLVVCRPEAVFFSHIEGAPDLVVEVISPSSVRQDRLRKLNLYARCGVQEYWLVTPFPFMVEVMQRNESGLFQVAGAYSEADRLISPRFPDLDLDLGAIHAAIPYPEEMREPLQAYSTF